MVVCKQKRKQAKGQDGTESALKTSIEKFFQSLRSNPKLGDAMRKRLPVVSVLEVNSCENKCIVIYIKSYVLKAIRKILPALKAETERKFGREVYFIGYRQIIPKPPKRTPEAKVHRPFRRTVTGVHESIMSDLVFPSEIMGKRTVYAPGTPKVNMVFLDKSCQSELEGRLKSFTDVYHRITGRTVRFQFPLYDCPMRLLAPKSKKAKA